MAGDQVGAELREDALDVLRDALDWRMTEARWGVVAEAVRRMAVTVRSGDAGAFREAVYDLELAGPVRATGVGDTPTMPAPEPVLEEVNELIHTVDGRADTQE